MRTVLAILGCLFLSKLVVSEEPGRREEAIELQKREQELRETYRKSVADINEERAAEITALLRENHRWNLRINDLQRKQSREIKRHQDDLKSVNEAYDKRSGELSKNREAAAREFEARFAALRAEQKKAESLEKALEGGDKESEKVFQMKWDGIAKEKETAFKAFDFEKRKLLENYFGAVKTLSGAFKKHLEELDRELTHTLDEAKAAQKRTDEALSSYLAFLRESPKREIDRKLTTLGLELKEEQERALADRGLRFFPWSYLLSSGGVRFSLEVGGDLLVRDSSGEPPPIWFRRVLDGYFIEGVSLRMEQERPITTFHGKEVGVFFWRINEKGRRESLSGATQHYLYQKWIESVIHAIDSPKMEDLTKSGRTPPRFEVYEITNQRFVIAQAKYKRIVDYVNVVATHVPEKITAFRRDYHLRREGDFLRDGEGLYEVVWLYTIKDGTAPYEKATEPELVDTFRELLEKWRYTLTLAFTDPPPIPEAARVWLRLSADEASAPRPMIAATRARFPKAAIVDFDCRNYKAQWEREGELSITEPGAKEKALTILGIEKSEREMACAGNSIAFVANGLEKGKAFKSDLSKDPLQGLQVPNLADIEDRIVATNYRKRALFLVDVQAKALKRVLLYPTGSVEKIASMTEKGETKPRGFLATGPCDRGGFELAVSTDGKTISVNDCPREEKK